jgi:hypothetical protein
MHRHIHGLAKIEYLAAVHHAPKNLVWGKSSFSGCPLQMFEGEWQNFNPIHARILILDFPHKLFENFSSHFGPTVSLVITCMAISILDSKTPTESFPKCSGKLRAFVGNHHPWQTEKVPVVKKCLPGHPFCRQTHP